ncbi:MAG: HAD-IIIC family phosphatase [Armatimonadota bacterium]|nr:HAD-IIIC family phosphatase [Armatimonadota bacterium]
MRVLSNVNIAGMRRFLEEQLPGQHMDFAPYDQVAQEFLDPSSPLNTERPKFVLVYLEGFRLFQQHSGEISEFAQAVDLVETRLKEVLEPIGAYLQANPERRALINTLAYPMSNGCHSLDRNTRFHTAMIDAFNLGLSRWRSERRIDKLIICDWAAAAARLGSASLYDERLWYIGRIPLSPRGQEELAALYARSIRALSGSSKKVLVVDLDNTIWGGVIGEDKMQGIMLGEDGLGKVYRDFQMQLRRLKDRGFLLAIASKNNEEDVDQVFAEHPMMALTYDDFVARKIGWNPKPESIAQLSKELALGLDSFVFVDDSPIERGAVKQALPDVSVPEFPSDPFTLNSWFESVTAEYFDTLMQTNEDKHRVEMYKADIRRQQESGKFADLEDYYRNLEMEMRIWVNHREQVQRIAQLTQKTNQFNLTTRRYDVSDIERFIASPNVRVYDTELVDRYGSNGIVGVIIAKIKGEAAEIDTCLLSCRVIGRKVEQAFFSFVADDLAKTGVKEIVAEYIPTTKNAPAEGLLDQLGFGGVDGLRRLRLSPGKVPGGIGMYCPDYIRVEAKAQ